MKRLELVNGLSYSARGVNCKKGEPFAVSDELAAKLMATGRFATVGEVVDETPPAAPPANGAGNPPVNGNGEGGQQTVPPAEFLSADKIDHMTKPELIDLAIEKGIDISECKNNTERAERICRALGLASNVQIGLE